MFENNSKFPKFFIYMLCALSIIMLIAMFFSSTIVAYTFFVGVIVCAIFMVLDRKYGSIFSNYKLTFFLFDLIALIAIISVVYYEISDAGIILNMLLAVLIGVQALMMIVDLFIIKNKNVSKNESLIVDTIKLCSMICILTYFFNVSKLFFAIDALAFEIAGFCIKLYINREKKEQVEEPAQKQETEIEKRIHSAGENEGEIE